MRNGSTETAINRQHPRSILSFSLFFSLFLSFSLFEANDTVRPPSNPQWITIDDTVDPIRLLPSPLRLSLLFSLLSSLLFGLFLTPSDSFRLLLTPFDSFRILLTPCWMLFEAGVSSTALQSPQMRCGAPMSPCLGPALMLSKGAWHCLGPAPSFATILGGILQQLTYLSPPPLSPTLLPPSSLFPICMKRSWRDPAPSCLGILNLL